MDINRIKRLQQEELKIKEDIDTLKRYIRQYKAELGHANTSLFRATRENWVSENKQNAEKGRNTTIWKEAKRLVQKTLSLGNTAKLLVGATPATVGKVDYGIIQKWAEARSAKRKEIEYLRKKQAEKAALTESQGTKGGRRLTRSKSRAAGTRRKSRQ
jgi:hypothetical protein